VSTPLEDTACRHILGTCPLSCLPLIRPNCNISPFSSEKRTIPDNYLYLLQFRGLQLSPAVLATHQSTFRTASALSRIYKVTCTCEEMITVLSVVGKWADASLEAHGPTSICRNGSFYIIVCTYVVFHRLVGLLTPSSSSCILNTKRSVIVQVFASSDYPSLSENEYSLANCNAD
jgi:hypothetical protein